MGCSRQYCKYCGEELIHRDNRKLFESSSSLGAILRREGPSEISLCDIDACIRKQSCNVLRIIEHKQPTANLGNQQQKNLLQLERAFAVAIKAGILDPRSGIFVLRGKVLGSANGRREVDFNGPQILCSSNGSEIQEFHKREELYSWLNCGTNWTPRKGKARVEYLK